MDERAPNSDGGANTPAPASGGKPRNPYSPPLVAPAEASNRAAMQSPVIPARREELARVVDDGGRPVNRLALERVLARATELQGGALDAPETISEGRLLEIAREVGIDVHHVQQALAEERARGAFSETEGGFLLDALGRSHVDGQRAVPGSAAEVQARIEAWMPRMESMAVRRRVPQRVSWEPRQTVLANALRVITSGNRAELVRADQVIATVTPVDDARSLVRFDVELSRLRRSQRNIGVGVGVVANAALFAGVATPVLFVASGSPHETALAAAVGVLAAVQAGAGFAIWRGVRNAYRRTVARVQLRVEQMLDELESGGMQSPPSLLTQVRGALTR